MHIDTEYTHTSCPPTIMLTYMYHSSPTKSLSNRGCFSGSTGGVETLHHTGNKIILKHIFTHTQPQDPYDTPRPLWTNTLCVEKCACVVRWVLDVCLFSIFALTTAGELAIFLQTWFSTVGWERAKNTEVCFLCYTSCLSLHETLSLCVCVCVCVCVLRSVCLQRSSCVCIVSEG